MNPKAVHDGGPAFPVPGLQHDESFNGLSARDHFAGLAMQAMLTTSSPIKSEETGAEAYDWIDFATCAYEMADAMLRARAA